MSNLSIKATEAASRYLDRRGKSGSQPSVDLTTGKVNLLSLAVAFWCRDNERCRKDCQ